VTQGTPIVSDNLITIPLRIHRKKDGTEFPVEITGRFFTRNGRPVHIAAIRDITGRKQMETQVRRLLEQQVAVNQLALALGESTSLEEVYQITYTHVCKLLDVQAFLISLYEAEAQLIRADYIVHNGVPFDVSRLPPIPLRAQGGIQSQVLRTGEPLYAPDYQAARTTGKIEYRVLDDGSIQEGPPSDTEEQAIRSALCVPLKVEGQTIGVLQVQSLQKDAYTQQDIDLLSAMASVAAVTIRSMYLLEQAREQAQRVEGIIDSVPEGVLLLDPALRIVLANPIAQRVLAVLTGDEKSAILHANAQQPLTHLGNRPIAELLTSPPKGQWHEISAGSRIFEAIARPMQSGPEPEGWVVVVYDATQTREVRAQLAQQERLAAVGQLASGIAHDFNNIMAVIVLYAQMMLQSPGLPERSREQVAIVNQQAWNATQLIQQILDFSRRAALERQPLDLLPLVKEHVKLLERTLPEHIEVTFVHDSGEHTVNADPTRIQQVLMNLAVNARDAMPEGGTLRIELERIIVRHGQSPLLPEMKPGDWIRLSVTDTGTGIPPDVLPHIFEPFFTTKVHGAGSGLGLPQVYGIVEQHEGRIGVATQVGTGTTFNIYLPALAVDTPEPLISEASTLQHGQGETLLVVEDDRAVQAALISTLEALNYTVLPAANGREALALLDQQGSHVALVLSDVVMPVMGGIALLHALRKQGWTVPVILLTGHPMEKDLEVLQTQGLSAWLLKPPDIEHLAQVIAAALHKEQS
jgi:signal transduction histidine kinase/ActR/RegA family two-component response regulator